MYALFYVSYLILYCVCVRACVCVCFK